MSTEPNLIVVVGDQGVGKTEFIKSVADRPILEDQNFYENLGICKFDIQDHQYFLHLMERPQKNFPSRANALVVVFDVTSVHTYMRVRGWISNIFDRVGAVIPTAIVANKIDLRDVVTEAVPPKNGLMYTRLLNERFSSRFIYEEVDSLSGKNCQSIVLKLLLAILGVFCCYRCQENQFTIKPVKNSIYCVTCSEEIDIDKSRAFNRLHFR